MEKNNTVVIETYNLQLFSDFLVDLTETDDLFEFWLYHKKCGIKSLIIGLPKSQQTKKEALELVENTITEDITFYIDEYMAD